jgi:hypothetical protein
MKPFAGPGGMPDRVDGCERARIWLHEACDERRPLDAERHISGCPACQRDAALFLDLEKLLASEPPVEVPADLVPSVVQLVRADIARARRNAQLAYAGAIAALVALAAGIAVFDVKAGATALGRDALGWAQLAGSYAPGTPDLRALAPEVPFAGSVMSYGWAALALAALILVVQLRLLGARRATA